MAYPLRVLMSGVELPLDGDANHLLVWPVTQTDNRIRISSIETAPGEPFTIRGHREHGGEEETVRVDTIDFTEADPRWLRQQREAGPTPQQLVSVVASREQWDALATVAGDAVLRMFEAETPAAADHAKGAVDAINAALGHEESGTS